MLSAFPEPQRLKEMVSFRLDENLARFSNPNNNLPTLIFDLIATAESEGWLEKLVNKAHEYNPGNDRLNQFFDSLKPRLENSSKTDKPRRALEIDWTGVSQAMLNEQMRLTSNPLTRNEGINYSTEQVHVPLGLVERKRLTRRQDDVNPALGSELYQETEITRRFEHKDFLKEVLQQGRSPKSAGKRIAIIGEPGAGKTTLLQQIARWVREEMEGVIAIWIPLADPATDDLEGYLIDHWLTAFARSMQQAEASSQLKDTFMALCYQGKVLLLLDGVDEMAITAGNPLGEIERQLRLGGLLRQVRLVLTCRLNLWDCSRHSLGEFDVYRTLEFAYPGQVEQFIRKWFGALQEPMAKQGERLCEELRESRQEWIRDLVKNPLRLTLLCFNWYLGQGSLPETKARLYEQFVEDFYEWKREQFRTTAKQRNRLNGVLGELAREAIDKESTRFWLRHDFVCGFLGEPDEADSLFWLALSLGWLNRVGVEAENTREAVYAFFHPTFQEYFAALAIDDWHFFVNHNNESPNPSLKSDPGLSYKSGKPIYRIFDLQWRGVILLWIGLSSKQVTQSHREEFIALLREFDDGIETCEYFGHQAYLLAAQMLSELSDYADKEIVFKIVISFGFGYFDEKRQRWITFLNPISREYANRIPLLEHRQIIKYLHAAINEHQSDGNLRRIAKLIGDIGVGKPESVKILISITPLTKDRDIYKNIIKSIGIIGIYNSTVIAALAKIFIETKYSSLRKQIVQLLCLVNDVDLIEAFRNNFKNDKSVSSIFSDFFKNYVNNQAVDKTYEVEQSDFLSTTEYQQIEITPTTIIIDNELMEMMIKTLYEADELEILQEAAWRLRRVGIGNLEVAKALVYALPKTTDDETRWYITDCLKSIVDKAIAKQIVSKLKNLLAQEKHQTDENIYKALWHCAQLLSYSEFYSAFYSDEADE